MSNRQQSQQSQPSPELAHFMRLAKRGKYSGASGGEFRAYALATAVLENVCGLDGEATRGLIEFIENVQAAPMAMQDEMGLGG